MPPPCSGTRKAECAAAAGTTAAALPCGSTSAGRSGGGAGVPLLPTSLPVGVEDDCWRAASSSACDSHPMLWSHRQAHNPNMVLHHGVNQS